MKIKTRHLAYEKVMSLPRQKHRKPLRPMWIFRAIIRVGSIPDLLLTRFKGRKLPISEPGPYLILMNHSSFIDLEIAHKLLWPMPFNIVCTSDGFVGKDLLMRLIGCIPTQKFVSDLGLVGDMRYALEELKSSVLMYPEASYSFDGTATPLPRRMGILLKRLNVPVLMIKTEGAFTRDPLYNCLQKRRVKVGATLYPLLTRADIEQKSVAELDAVLDEAFTYDHFAWQQKNGVEVREKFRADGLNRILYRCAVCGTEGHMEGKGTTLTCHHCGAQWELTPSGRLEGPGFDHIPDWYRWEREEVRREVEAGAYRLDLDVDIGVLVDHKAIYMVGEGHLTHDGTGFHLTGCDGKLEYSQKPQGSYSLYADYYWYEIGDVVCIGNQEVLYYCFPKHSGDVVAKARLATEEMFQLHQRERMKKRAKTVVEET